MPHFIQYTKIRRLLTCMYVLAVARLQPGSTFPDHVLMPGLLHNVAQHDVDCVAGSELQETTRMLMQQFMCAHTTGKCLCCVL